MLLIRTYLKRKSMIKFKMFLQKQMTSFFSICTEFISFRFRQLNSLKVLEKIFNDIRTAISSFFKTSPLLFDTQKKPSTKSMSLNLNSEEISIPNLKIKEMRLQDFSQRDSSSILKTFLTLKAFSFQHKHQATSLAISLLIRTRTHLLNK